MDAHDLQATEKVSASRKLGRDDARALLKGMTKLLVAKGKTFATFELSGKIPDAVVDAMLGPTGNLRAPTLRVGKTILVGFQPEMYASVLG